MLDKCHSVGVGHCLGPFDETLCREVEKTLDFTLDNAGHYEVLKFGVGNGSQFDSFTVGRFERVKSGTLFGSECRVVHG